MTGPPPAVAAVRVAVRRCLEPMPKSLILVACSGGADSLALAAALAFVGPRLGHQVGFVTVDHQLQEGSAERAEKQAQWATTFFDPVRVERVDVDGAGGPEAAARTARYAALDAVAAETGAAAVLLGHTRDDQAETVLLALARGSGPRGLAGMAPIRGVYRRPLLEMPRALVRQSCRELGLAPWDDPHNFDDRYARARVRELIDTLGDKVVANLARTAALVAMDSTELDAQAERVSIGAELDARALAVLSPAIRTRVLRRWALAVGAVPAALSYQHIRALDELVTAWRGQGPVSLPGGVWVRRAQGLIGVLKA